MKECDKHKMKFERALYNELTEEEEKSLNKHLGVCRECADEFNELKETLALFQEREREEPDPEFMDNFWEKIEPHLEGRDKPRESWIDRIKGFLQPGLKWSPQLAGGIAILLIGIFLGRFIFTGAENQNNNIAGIEKEGAEAAAVQASAERYIDRSKILLLGLMNFDPASDEVSSINLEKHQEISSELVSQAGDLQNQLENSPNKQLKQLISDIEVILMQIANLEKENDLSGIKLIKDGVDKRGIFLKINIREMQKNFEEGKNDDKKQNRNI